LFVFTLNMGIGSKVQQEPYAPLRKFFIDGH
jgi:hypothetical protein